MIFVLLSFSYRPALIQLSFWLFFFLQISLGKFGCWISIVSPVFQMCARYAPRLSSDLRSTLFSFLLLIKGFIGGFFGSGLWFELNEIYYAGF